MAKEIIKFSFKVVILFLLPISIAFVWCSAIIAEMIAVYAILIALFKDNLLNFFMPPRLVITTSTDIEHFQEVESKQRPGNIVIENQYWLSIRVTNLGLGIAKNVSVYLNGIESSHIPNFDGYKSLQLKRSYLETHTIKTLPPKVGFNFSFLYLSQKNRDQLHFNFVVVPNALGTIICNQNESVILKFEIFAVSDNSKVSIKNVIAKFIGDYKNGFTVNYCSKT